LSSVFSTRAQQRPTNFAIHDTTRKSTRYCDTIFYDAVSFANETFTEKTEFMKARFKGIADFQDCQFKRKVTFAKSIFSSDVYFNGASFLGDCDFTNAVFMGDLDFSNIQDIATKIDLTTAKTDSVYHKEALKRGLKLEGADISKIRIDYSMFYLKFDDNSSFEARSAVYKSLLNTFKTNGFTESYELLDKEYREFVHTYKGSKLTLWLDKYWWNFGYSKYYIFFWAIGFVLFFSCINFFCLPFLNAEVYPVIALETSSSNNRLKAGLLRFYHSIADATVIFLSFSIKPKKLNFKYWYGVLYVFIIYLSGIICIAYMASFIAT
jgi:hypothetical protein